MRWWFAIPFTLASAPTLAAEPTREQIEFFEKKVRPILVENCVGCHGPKKQSGGLRLDTAAGLKAGADGAPVIVPGEPAKSKLIKAVNRVGDNPMPPEPKTPLAPEAVAALTEWVKAGAAFPDDQALAPGIDPRKHWAFQPVRHLRCPKSETRSTKFELKSTASYWRNLVTRSCHARRRPTGGRLSAARTST